MNIKAENEIIDRVLKFIAGQNLFLNRNDIIRILARSLVVFLKEVK